MSQSSSFFLRPSAPPAPTEVQRTGGEEQPEAAPAATASAAASDDPLRGPETGGRLRIRWSVAFTILAVHALALGAAVPWLFSWSGLVLMFVGFYAFGSLGINLCYHRLLTHRAFKTPTWLSRFFSILGFCNLQGSAIRWVAAHRMHHQHSDQPPDPHSPMVNFLWSHIGWLVVINPRVDAPEAVQRYAADLYKDPFHRAMDHAQSWMWLWAAHVLLFAAAGFGIGLYTTGQAIVGAQLAASWVVWGVMVRSVIVWHVTWAINSVTHVWGYRTYETTDDSRNNWLMGYIGMGEGWHNNHHADQRSAQHGMRWWELDVTYLTIRLLQAVGLAKDVVKPSRNRGTTHDIDNKKAADEG